MPRGLDHVVHAVGDLEGAAELYRRRGFTVGARNRHSWGTHNHGVQLSGFFIELLTVAEPGNLGTDGFSNLFGRFHQSFIGNQDGLSLLLLATDDAATDAAALQSAGIAASEVLKFEREGKRPDGAAVSVAFSLASARMPGRPGAGFRGLPAAFSGEFLESGASAACQHREGRRGCCSSRGESNRPSHFPLRVHWSARLACDVERRQRRDPARGHQGHGSSGVSQPLWDRTARHLAGCAPCRAAISRARPQCAASGT